MNGLHKQYIQGDIIFNYVFHFGLQENVFRQVKKIHLSGAGEGVCWGLN